MKFLKIFALTFFIAILANGNASAQFSSKESPPSTNNVKVVYVPGSPDCTGIFSDYCGWVGWGGDPLIGDYYAEGGVGGGSSSSYNGDDGTMGVSSTQNRTEPGCLREKLAMEQASSLNGSPQPMGTQLPLTLLDPAYQSPGWAKYSIVQYYRQWDRNSNSTYEWKTEVHYMYNSNTYQVAQVKMKQSFEYGCTGIKKS